MIKSLSFVFFIFILNVLFSMEVTSNNSDSIHNYTFFRAGEIKPAGWIKEQLHRDLTEGYIGHFDKVHHTVRHNVFVNQNRRSNKRFRIIKEWWSGEHEGYWKDAIVRMAFLTGNEKYKRQSEIWMNELVENAGKDGYIGIYEDCEKSDCRFNHTRGNGELWATSRILMAMLAYYEYTGDEKVFEAAKNAADLIIKSYEDRNYFARKGGGGGVSHGVGFFENLEWLYRLTGDKKYNDFAVKLYEDFNNGIARDDDLKHSLLLDEDRYYRKHGAHIAEGLFIPTYIASIRKEKDYTEAAQNSLEKLFYHITPGGAMRCDEWIHGRKGTADELYEYCGIAEMVGPYNRIISMTGDITLGDRIETMVFNAGQGSRFPTLSALSYLTSDNRIKINHREIGKRESYDAAHRAAACCVLNGGRTMPYYVEGMWLKDANTTGIAAVLFGPSRLETQLDGKDITIEEKTNYPFGDKIRFVFTTSEAALFSFTIRKPFDANNMDVNIPEDAVMEELEDKIVITHRWTTGDVVDVDFNFDVQKIPQRESKTVRDKGFYLKRGALVYALKFEHDIDTVKEHNHSGFYRYKIYARDKKLWNLRMDKDSKFTYTKKYTGDVLHPFEHVVVELTGEMKDPKNNTVPVTLIPEGNTILRRVTFSSVNED